jgi:hypothetical protein
LPFVFVSERGSPFTTAGLARIIERAAAGAGLELKAHPHMLRHACGYALANKGHDTRAIQGLLGHRSITSTAVYTALAPNRFKDFWRSQVRDPDSRDWQGEAARSITSDRHNLGLLLQPEGAMAGKGILKLVPARLLAPLATDKSFVGSKIDRGTESGVGYCQL